MNGSEEIITLLDKTKSVREENNQIKLQYYYGVNYQGGLCTCTRKNLPRILETHAHVYGAEYSSPRIAYLQSVEHYVDDCWELQPCTRPDIPTYESVKNQPYHEPNYKVTIPEKQFWACMSTLSECDGYVGIYDSIQGALDFIYDVTPCYFQEYPSYEAAYAWLSGLLTKPLLKYSAYIGDYLPMVAIPVNQITSLDYFLSITQKPISQLRAMFLIKIPILG